LESLDKYKHLLRPSKLLPEDKITATVKPEEKKAEQLKKPPVFPPYGKTTAKHKCMMGFLAILVIVGCFYIAARPSEYAIPSFPTGPAAKLRMVSADNVRTLTLLRNSIHF